MSCVIINLKQCTETKFVETLLTIKNEKENEAKIQAISIILYVKIKTNVSKEKIILNIYLVSIY